MMLTTVPFAGFYCSVHDSELDHEFARLFQDENGAPNEALNKRFAELLDWEIVYEAYAKAYVENFALRFEVKIKWESMTSPREYNFTTDRLFAYISLKEVRRLRKHVVNEKDFRGACYERFTSRSGFMSSYSNDPDDWGGMQTWDHNQVGTLLVALANQESDGDDGFDSWEEVELMEYERCNGEYDRMFYDAARKGPELDRIDKVYGYLRDRERRKWVMKDHDLTTIERRV